MNIFLFILWAITGLLVLIRQGEVTKLDYALVWLILMSIFLRDVLLQYI